MVALRCEWDDDLEDDGLAASDAHHPCSAASLPSYPKAGNLTVRRQKPPVPPLHGSPWAFPRRKLPVYSRRAGNLWVETGSH
jgi:hypothetical protein